MTTKEAVALLERYSNYDGMGIPNLAGCKEAMRVAVDALKEACPELAESEDERIRKALIEVFKKKLERGFEWVEYGIPNRSVLDWLEKQKEQKPAEWSDYNDKVNVPYCSSEPEWSDNFEENIRNLLHDKLTWHSEDGSMSSTVFIDDKTLKDIINGIWFYVGKEALKYPSKELNVTKWSEEDIKKIRSEEYTKGFNDAAFGGKLKKWSVEDEDRIRQIERIAQQAGCTQKLQEEIHDWLKSLRPQPKQEWSEDDADMLNCCISSIEEAKENRYAYKETDGDTSYDREIAWLKSLRPDSYKNCNSRWKPSEEQMEALNTLLCIGDFSYVGQATKLQELYIELKKL